MAYDPNDPKDKAIVEGLIADALETAKEEHEADKAGLVKKNKELVDKLTKARKGEDNGGEVERLERELEENATKLRETEGKLRQTEREHKKATEELGTTKGQLETESNFSRRLLVENGLTEALVEANVAPQFMPAARALLEKQVEVKVDGDSRKAVIGDKSLSDFVKEWSSSDHGKVFIAAPTNGGGGTTPPGSPPSGSKKIYEMSEGERAAAYKANPVDFDARIAAGENVAPKS